MADVLEVQVLGVWVYAEHGRIIPKVSCISARCWLVFHMEELTKFGQPFHLDFMLYAVTGFQRFLVPSALFLGFVSHMGELTKSGQPFHLEETVGQNK